ncbi:MAG: hypothetical protein WC273_03215 [Dehalococcoidia bacterium]
MKNVLGVFRTVRVVLVEQIGTGTLEPHRQDSDELLDAAKPHFLEMSTDQLLKNPTDARDSSKRGERGALPRHHRHCIVRRMFVHLRVILLHYSLCSGLSAPISGVVRRDLLRSPCPNRRCMVGN